MAILTVALLQLVGCGRDREASLRKGDAACRRAAVAGADLALFPEMWSLGYESFDAARAGEREAWLALASAREDAYVAHFGALARELDMAIGITYLERASGAPRNSLTLFDRRGAEVLHYSKVHLGPWTPPDTDCAPGDTFPVGTLETRADSLRVGAMICFDREFPEAGRMLMLGGAELILVPNACPLDDREAGIGDLRLAQLRGRAFENLVAVALANYAAPQYDGRSVAFYPDGTTLVAAGEAEEIVLAPIDLARLRAFREAEVLRDSARRPESYGPIADPGHGRRKTRRR